MDSAKLRLEQTSGIKSGAPTKICIITKVSLGYDSQGSLGLSSSTTVSKELVLEWDDDDISSCDISMRLWLRLVLYIRPASRSSLILNCFSGGNIDGGCMRRCPDDAEVV